MKKNKMSRYFTYAIGEIILVVIGILIALQINNWNENRKNKEQEIVLLKGISGDLDLDILQLQSNINSSMERVARIKQALELLNQPKEFTLDKFAAKALDFVFDNYFISNSGVFDEAVSSGKMSLIAQRKIRKQIFNYYRTAKFNYMDNTIKQSTDEVLTPIFMDALTINKEAFKMFGMDLSNISIVESFSLSKLKENKDFWKMVMIKMGNTSEQIKNWKLKEKRASNLKEQVDLEIKSLSND